MSNQLHFNFESPYKDLNDHRNVLQDIKECKYRVAHILEYFPEARNNDNLLCAMYWKMVDQIEVVDDMIHATSAEAITRARRKLNEEGRYLPTCKEVLKKRRLNEKIIRQGIHNI